MQGIFQKENTDKALKYGIYRHLPTYEKIIRNLVSFCIKNESWRIITTERKQIRFSSDRARFPLKVVYRLFTTLPHTHKLLLALQRLRDTHVRAHSFFKCRVSASALPGRCAFRQKHPARSQRRPIVCRGTQRHRRAQDAKKARPIGRALFGAMIAIHTARVTLPLRRQRVHA